MSRKYILNHFDDIKAYANVIEERLDDECCTPDNVLKDNEQSLKLAKKYGLDYIFIDDKYDLMKYFNS
jgi:hypothetical protein